MFGEPRFVQQLEGWVRDKVCVTVVFNLGGNLVSVTSPDWMWRDDLLSVTADTSRGPLFMDHAAIVAMIPSEDQDEWSIHPRSFADLLTPPAS